MTLLSLFLGVNSRGLIPGIPSDVLDSNHNLLNCPALRHGPSPVTEKRENIKIAFSIIAPPNEQNVKFTTKRGRQGRQLQGFKAKVITSYSFLSPYGQLSKY